MKILSPFILLFAFQAMGQVTQVSEYPNSTQLIKSVSHELAQEIRRSSPQLFTLLKGRVDQGELADIIENIRLRPDTEGQLREEKRLILNFGQDQDVSFIEAYEGYFKMYETQASRWLELDTFAKTKFEEPLKLKLIHEASHLFGYETEDQAHGFALRVRNAMERNLVRCVGAEVNITYSGKSVREVKVEDQFSDYLTLARYVNKNDSKARDGKNIILHPGFVLRRGDLKAIVVNPDIRFGVDSRCTGIFNDCFAITKQSLAEKNFSKMYEEKRGTLVLFAEQWTSADLNRIDGRYSFSYKPSSEYAATQISVPVSCFELAEPIGP